MRKKNSFLLLELVLCLSLFTSALLPLLDFPLRILRKQEAAWMQMQLARQAKLELVNLLGRLYAGEIPLSSLLKNSPALPAHKIALTTLRQRQVPFACTYAFKTTKTKKAQSGKRIYLTSATMHLQSTKSKESFTFTTLLCLSTKQKL